MTRRLSRSLCLAAALGLTQALGASPDGKRRYDLIVWRKPDGEPVEVCFDVTTVFEETIRHVEEEEAGDPRRPPR